MTKFETGKTYIYKFYGDRDVVVPCKIIKRTAKTITFKDNCGETMTRRIYILDGVEKVDIGHYSMAPSLGADRSAEALDKAEEEAKLAEAAKEAEEEAARKEARDTTKKVVRAAIELYTAMYPVKAGAPTVSIGSSEMAGLPGCSDEAIEASLKAADLILGTLDMWQHRVRESEGHFYGWYHKTDFTIIYTDENGEESTYQGRYDLGDGEGGLLNHIRNFGEWHRTHEEFGKEKAIPDETNDILEFVKMLEKAA